MDTNYSELQLLIVIVNYRTAHLTIRCLKSLEAEVAALPRVRVAVVDNASGDAGVLADAISRNRWECWVDLIVSEKNGGFSYGNNRAIAPALTAKKSPRFVLLLNPDTEVFPNALRALLDFMNNNPKVGVAGSSLVNEDGTNWPMAFRFPSITSEFEQGTRLRVVSQLLHRSVVAREMSQDRPEAVDWVSGASMIIRHEVFRDIGLMDEGYFLYFEEVDFCIRARRSGWSCWYVPGSRVMHLAGQSTGMNYRNERPKRRPSFWFEPRHRYFMKNHGRFYTLLADLAFGLGFTLFRFRRVLQRKLDADPPYFLLDFWKHSIRFHLLLMADRR